MRQRTSLAISGRVLTERSIEQTPDDGSIKRAPEVVAVGGRRIERPVSDARKLGAGGRRGKARNNPELSALKPGYDVTNVLRLMQGGNTSIKVLNNLAPEKPGHLTHVGHFEVGVKAGTEVVNHVRAVASKCKVVNVHE